jgi:hypothetical protein
MPTSTLTPQEDEMVEEASGTMGEETTSGNRTLRTCLIIGGGCAGIVIIGFCILMLVGIPLVRSVVGDIDWQDSEALIEVFTGDLQSTLEASMGEEFDEDLLFDLESTLDATLPEDLEEGFPPAFPDMDFQGIQFSYPEGENYGAMPEVLPAELEVEWFSQPERIVFTLLNYPLMDTFHEPRIIVMSTEELLAVNSGLEPSLDELKEVLGTQTRNIERVPYIMPSFNAGQIITTQVDFLTFDGGKGVRFVTQYGQAAWPINNLDLFYAFQGLTDDGAYLINAVLPVSHPSLPTDGDSYIGDDYEGFIAGYEDYLVTTKQSLDSQTLDSFHPGLQALDAMMASFQVNMP